MREEVLAKIICGGLAASLMLTLIAGLLYMLEETTGGLSLTGFLGLPFSLKFLIISLSLFVFFVLLLFTFFLWRIGYRLVLKYLFGIEAGPTSSS